MRNVIVDTSALLDGFDIFDCDTVWLVATVADELDAKKRDKNTNLAKSAQRAIKDIYTAQDRGIVKFRDKFTCSVPFDMAEPDNKILAFTKEILTFDHDAVLVSSDYCMLAKAKSINIPCKKYSTADQNLYTGMFEVSGTADAINAFFQDIEDGHNSNGLFENQYVIVNQIDGKSSEYRYTNGKLKRLKLPNIDGVKPLNSEQRCAFDLILNKDIPIKVLVGTAGSGKTYIATRLGIYMVKYLGEYGKFLMIRNPIGSGEDPGALPGTLDEKCGEFWKSIKQHIDSMDQALGGKTKTKTGKFSQCDTDVQIETNIPYFMKGMSYGSTYMMFDEAEDADKKLIRMIGARIESDSCVVLTGDYRQAENKFERDNGIIQFIEQKKGNPLIGIVVLSEDVRSPASKVFADFY